MLVNTFVNNEIQNLLQKRTIRVSTYNFPVCGVPKKGINDKGSPKW